MGSPRFREAEHQAIEVLEAEAFRRAVRGTPRTRKFYWHGEAGGEETRVEYSDSLLLALLRARVPERYVTKVEMTVLQIVKFAGVESTAAL
jgi:hypothetical protein